MVEDVLTTVLEQKVGTISRGGATENGMTSYNSTTKGRFFTLFDVSSLIFFLMSLNGRVAVFKDRVYAPHHLNISGATSKTSRFSDEFSTTNGSDTVHTTMDGKNIHCR